MPSNHNVMHLFLSQQNSTTCYRYSQVTCAGTGYDTNHHITSSFRIIALYIRLLYWNSNKRIERMSMDGKNRTAIVDVDTGSYHDVILSLTLDYQAQVLYWVFGNDSNGSLIIKCSNVDGTNQQTILQLQNVHYDYYNYHRFYHYSLGLSISVYNETLFLSSSPTRELYKIRTNGDTLLLINNSAHQVFCGFRNLQVKVINQPSG